MSNITGGAKKPKNPGGWRHPPAPPLKQILELLYILEQ